MDGRSDLFSLGCVLYRLLAGRLPFGSPTVLSTLSSIQSHNPVPPAELGKDISQDLSDLTMCLLEKQPINRPQSCEQLVELLTTPREQWPIVVPSYSSANNVSEPNQLAAGKPVKSSHGRGWSSWITTIVGLLLLGGFGWLLATQIIRIRTPEGEVVIKTSDDNVEVEVLQDGQVIRVIDSETEQSFSLKSGQYSFNAKASDGDTKNSFTIEPKTLTMHRGDKAIVKVTVEPRAKAEVKPALQVFESLGGANKLIDDPRKVTPAPLAQINKPYFEGKTFAQWLHRAKFDRAEGATANAILGCVKTVDTDEEWAQLLEVIISFKIESIRGEEKVNSRQAYDAVRDAVSADHLFNFVESEIAQGKSTSLWFFRDWFRKHFNNSDSPPRPWKQINELIGIVNKNIDKPNAIKFLAPIFQSVRPPKGTEAQACLANLRSSPAGKRIRELALTGDLPQRHEFYDPALSVFDEVAIREIYERDLLDPALNNRSLDLGYEGAISSYRYRLVSKIFASMDPDFWARENEVADAAAEERYVTEASDLLVKIADDFLEKRAMFTKRGDRRGIADNVFWGKKILGRFFDVAQRTSDESVKQRMLEKLEAVRLANKDRRRVADLDYVIAYCKGEPLPELSSGTALRMRDPKNGLTDKVEKLVSDKVTPKAMPAAINKPIYDGRTFTQWLQAAKFDRARGARVIAALGCARTANTDEEWEQFLPVMASIVRNNEKRKYGNEYRSVIHSIDADRLFDFVKSEIAQGKPDSLPLFELWLTFHVEVKYPHPPLPWKQVNELTDVISQNVDKPGTLGFLQPILHLLYDQGPEAETYLTKLRSAPAGTRVKELALTGDLQERFDVYRLALFIFFDRKDVREIYKNDLLDLNLEQQLS